MTRPDFLVIGAPRAGTTLLHHILLSHPEVYVPRKRKEIQFFDRHFERGPGWYESYFPRHDQAPRYRAIGEATPGYLAAPAAPARIHALLPGCRLVAILRNPVDRAFSAYQYARRSRNERLGFDAYLERNPNVIDDGLYAKHLGAYLSLFAEDRLLVMILEELVADPAHELERLRRFLDLGRGWDDVPSLLAQRVHASEVPRFRAAFASARRFGHFLMHHDMNWPVRAAKRLGIREAFGRSPPAPPMPAASRTRLSAYYQADVAGLARLLRRDLDVWRLGPA